MKDTPIMAEPEYYMVAGNLKMHYLIIYETVATLRAKVKYEFKCDFLNFFLTVTGNFLR